MSRPILAPPPARPQRATRAAWARRQPPTDPLARVDFLLERMHRTTFETVGHDLALLADTLRAARPRVSVEHASGWRARLERQREWLRGVDRLLGQHRATLTPRELEAERWLARQVQILSGQAAAETLALVEVTR